MAGEACGSRAGTVNSRRISLECAPPKGYGKLVSRQDGNSSTAPATVIEPKRINCH
jgi:hypothetical protein